MRLSEPQRTALRWAALAFLLSRLVVVAVGVVTVLIFGDEGSDSEAVSGGISQPFGRLGNLLVATTSHWDSGYYISIARGGYEGHPDFAAFLPLYPLAIYVLRPAADLLVTSEHGPTLLAGVAISCVASVVALYLLHRLVEIDFGDAVAHRTVVLIVVFPVSFFLSAVYTEGLFLMLSVAALYAARLDRWALAGLAAGLATATRTQGVLLLIPLALMLLYGPRTDRPTASGVGWRPRFRPSPRQAGWLLLAPAGFAAFCGYLWAVLDDPLASFAAQREIWHRQATVPVIAAAWGVEDAVWALRNVRSGVNPITDWPTRAALTDLGFLAFAVVACIGALRRLPIAYSAYAISAVMFVLTSVPDPGREHLQSVPRFVLVLFPLFIWLALWARSGWRWWITLTASVGLLIFYTGLFATFHWVA